MKQETIESILDKMKGSEFLQEHQFLLLDSKSNEFIKQVNEIFGFNDGEPLDEDGIEFVMQLIRYKWFLANAVYEE